MKNIKVIIPVVAAASAVIVIFTIYKPNVFNKNTISPEQTILSPKTSSEGSVTVQVTPKDLSQSSPTWDFEIVLDTHSGNSDQDLTETAILIDEKGNEFSPISWEGDPPQGHHRSGVLKFKPISQRPKSIELKIKQIGNVNERIFEWELR